MRTPCIGHCRLMDNVCTGCSRSLEEIRGWTSYTETKREEIIYTIMNKKKIKYLADGVVHSLDIPNNWTNITEEFVMSYFHEYFRKFHGSAEIEILKDNTINEGARLLKG